MSTCRVSATEKRYHHGNLREALVTHGLVLLAAGQTGFSLRELTQQLGVSANAAYRHFASKEDLLAAMAAQGFRQLTAAQAAAQAEAGAAIPGLLAAGRAYVQFAATHPAWFRLMFGRFAQQSPSAEMQEAATMAYQGLRVAVAAVLGYSEDDPHLLPASMYAWSLVHGLSQLIVDGLLQAHGHNVDALIDDVLQQTVLFGSRLLTQQTATTTV